MKRLFLGVAIASVLAGCTTPLERRQASGEFDYIEQPEPVELKVPADLTPPSVSEEFAIPAKAESAQALGQRIDVRPPLQVLPLGESIRLQEGTDSITVLIEDQAGDRNLKQELMTNLKEFIEHKKIGVESIDEVNGEIVTQWVETVEKFGGSWWGKDEYRMRQKYKFDVAVKDNGRTGSLSIELLGHEEFIEDVDQDINLTDSDKRRYAIDMLNSSISYMNFKRQQEAKIAQVKDASGLSITLGKDANGNVTYDTPADFERVWSRMEKLLPVIGFTVKDLDKSQGTYYVDYDPNDGFWASLWGDNDLLALKSGAYQVSVQPADNATQISFKDAEGQPLDNEVVTQLFNQFSEYMSKSQVAR